MAEIIDPKKVGLRIRDIRKQKGLSMTAFAEKIDEKAKSGTVSNWETGKNLPNNERLKTIAELGEMSVEQLLYGDYEARIRNILMNQEAGEDVAQVVQLVIRGFENSGNRYPTREEIVNDYNYLVSVINNTREKNQSTRTLATNLYNAKRDLALYLEDIENLELIESVNKEVKSAIEQYNIYFDKSVSEVVDETKLNDNLNN